MIKITKCVVISLLSFLMLCTSGLSNTTSDSIIQFSLDLYKQITTNKNMLLSPLSVPTAFSDFTDFFSITGKLFLP